MMSCEAFKCAREGFFLPNNCLQPQHDMAVSVKWLRLCLTVVEVYVCKRVHVPQHACMVFIYNAELNAMYACMHGYCRSVLSTGVLSRVGMARYIGQDVRNGANSIRACSWTRDEPFKSAREGVFQPNNCFQPQQNTAVSVKRLRLCLTVLQVYVCNRGGVRQHACMLCIHNVDFHAMYACMPGYCRSVLSTGLLSRGGMSRHSCVDISNGANSTGACSWTRSEPFKCVHGGVFQPNHCLQPQLDMAVS